MDTVLEVKNLCKSFPGFSLQSVDFQLERGTITGSWARTVRAKLQQSSAS